jgi:hypothetical protein
MKKNINLSLFILILSCVLSTKMVAQLRLDYSKPLLKNPLSVKKDTTAQEKNLLFIPSRDGNYQVRNLFYNPQKDGKVSVVLLNDVNETYFADVSFHKMQFEALLSDIKLKKEQRLKGRKTVK